MQLVGLGWVIFNSSCMNKTNYHNLLFKKKKILIILRQGLGDSFRQELGLGLDDSYYQIIL